MPSRYWLIAVVAVVWAVPADAQSSRRAAGPASCVQGAAVTVPSATVEGPSDIRLPDGRTIFLAGIAAADGDDPARRAFVQQWLSRAPFSLTLAAPRSDRWGRWPGTLWRGNGAAAEDLAGALVGAGLAVVEPAALSSPCAKTLLAREDAARRAGLGLWKTGEALLDAGKPETILAREGRYAVVEGRISSVRTRTGRTYLNFGTIWTQDFAVTVSKPNLRKFEASGMTWTMLEGRRVRVRGVVAETGGPRIEVALPEEIERLD